MSYQTLKPIPGTPGDENTAVTMRSIKEILEEEGAAHLLQTRPETSEMQQPEAPLTKPAPLRELAETANAAPLQKPPVIETTETEDEPLLQEAPRVEAKSGILPRLLGLK